MSDERRSHEATSLRKFFDEQISHLQTLLGGLVGHSEADVQQAEEDKRIVENFVDASNAKMRAVHGYCQKLRGHVRALYNHVLEVAERIPPPVDLNRDAFGQNPLVNALFASSTDIDGLFKVDPEANDYLRAYDARQVPVMYALLTADKCVKHTLGVGMVGDVLVHDVPQQAVNFSAHKCHTPCDSEAALNTALKNYLFDCVVALAKQEMAARMAEYPLKLDASYEARIHSLANPDVYLNALLEYLEEPAKLLSIDKTHFKLSKLGIKLNGDDTQCANEFDLYELIWNGSRRNVVLQIAHPR